MTKRIKPHDSKKGWDDAQVHSWNTTTPPEDDVEMECVWNGARSRQGDYLTILPDEEYVQLSQPPNHLSSYDPPGDEAPQPRPRAKTASKPRARRVNRREPRRPQLRRADDDGPSTPDDGDHGAIRKLLAQGIRAEAVARMFRTSATEVLRIRQAGVDHVRDVLGNDVAPAEQAAA
ncbi:MAG: hypothetical protein OXG35_33375 [Acidobacteria bacterium]|nr:hypothetical protein [Acidobacteriota bacterium]